MVRRPQLAWTLVWLTVMGLVVLASVAASDGHLIYSLDDPYIHLAVAETILRGGYGVNLAEYASPSSSVLYPLMLVATEAIGLGVAGPLVLNLIATAASVYLVMDFAYRRLRPADGCSLLFHLFCGTFLLAISAFALPMTGLEHSWHVLLVVAAFVGLVRVAEGEAPPWWLAAALVAMPLIRFEGLALSGAILGVLVWRGHWRRAALTAIVLGGALAAYAITMSQLGLPPLPSSVMLKSAVAASSVQGSGAGAVATAIGGNVLLSLDERQGALLFLALAALVVALGKQGRPTVRSAETVVAVVAVVAIGAHLLAGKYGWFARYEVYVTGLAVLSLAYVYRDAIRRIMGGRAYVIQLVLLLVTGVATWPYAQAVMFTPAASRGIYEQQYQMHRFVRDFYREGVAVNDLGWVSYRNDATVLDLWGLGSEAVREARAQGNYGADVISALVAQHRIGLAMVYENWFAETLPATWTRVARLETRRVTAAEDTVTFFATDKAAIPAISAALAEFAVTLPAGVRLTILEPAEQAQPSLSH